MKKISPHPRANYEIEEYGDIAEVAVLVPEGWATLDCEPLVEIRAEAAWQRRKDRQFTIVVWAVWALLSIVVLMTGGIAASRDWNPNRYPDWFSAAFGIGFAIWAIWTFGFSMYQWDKYVTHNGTPWGNAARRRKQRFIEDYRNSHKTHAPRACDDRCL